RHSRRKDGDKNEEISQGAEVNHFVRLNDPRKLGGNIAIELHIFLPVNLVYALSSQISAFGEDPTVNVKRCHVMSNNPLKLGSNPKIQKHSTEFCSIPQGFYAGFYE
ncbi:hypothetical protein J6590_096504, partial [Homalodisca vitripennis]